MTQTTSIFLLGATGFIGGSLVKQLALVYPNYPIMALVRGSDPDELSQRKEVLSSLHPNISFVEGDLESHDVIQEQAEKHPVIINVASSDHHSSVEATLIGLEKNSSINPGKPPLYIHISGLGITSDNARGEWRDEQRSEVWTDIGLDLLNDTDNVNTHLESDVAIVKAGTRKKDPIRTAIVFPGWVYGVGEGVQKVTMPVRIFTGFNKAAGHAGTWGPGQNRMRNIHVKDVASAILTVFTAAMKGKADEGAEGLYFTISPNPMVTLHEWSSLYGDILAKKGIIKEGGAKPFSEELVAPLGHYGWSLLGVNQFAKSERLYKFGWEPVESSKISLLESFPAEAELALGITL